eukprot:COSAG04_NODE_2479_length_4047_cov_15.043060_2_plen_79_part_00
MAPSISLGSAATVISFLALAGLQLETRFRVGEVLAAELSSDEPEPDLPLGQRQVKDRLGRLEGTVAAQGASLARKASP